MTLGLNTARDASGIAYLASDGLGSVSEALSPSGTATGAVLYSPYGGVRYSSGTMPTSKGFTGQYSDTASSGLDYYGARYYDPSLGQFTSADTVSDGINRYGYVKGNPETFTDPSGHRLDDGGGSGIGAGNDSLEYWQAHGQHNYRQDYLDDWGWYQFLGDGYKFDNRDSSPQDPEERTDGEVLANYFKLYVVRDPRKEGDKIPDYRVVESWQHAPCFCVYNPLLPDNEYASTSVELYTPTSPTAWKEESPWGGGWVKGAKDKGSQAPIVAIDLDAVDPGGHLTKAELQTYANDIIFWPKQGGPSHVARVIYIRDGVVIQDVDPFGYGPPGRPNG